MKPEKQLPMRRWLTRAMVIEFVGSRRELERLERAGRLVPEHPAGCKHKRYVRAQVLSAVVEE